MFREIAIQKLDESLNHFQTHSDIIILLLYALQESEEGDDCWPIISRRSEFIDLFEHQRIIGWENEELGILDKKFRSVQMTYMLQRNNMNETQAKNATTKWIHIVKSELW